MPNKPEMETRTVEELREDAAALVKRVATTKQPVRIAAEGLPPVVLLDEDTYDWYIHLINLGKMLNEGMEDIRQGRTIPLEDFLREFPDAKKVPGRSVRRGPRGRS